MQVDDEYIKWQTEPTPSNMSGVLRSLDPAITRELQRYDGPREVLKTRARLLAAQAVKTYDPTQGAALGSWVVTNMKPLSRYAGNISIARTPEVSRQRAAELSTYSKDFEMQHGREPSDDELADESGMSKLQVTKLRHRVPRVRSESAHMDAGGPDFDTDLPAETGGIPVSYSFDVVYKGLNPREKAIADMKTGRKGKALSNQEIARRLGVSAPYISQVSASIAKKVQEVHRAL
jgi:DNA-directed RNA polymerase specialized sigma subunit